MNATREGFRDRRQSEQHKSLAEFDNRLVSRIALLKKIPAETYLKKKHIYLLRVVIESATSIKLDSPSRVVSRPSFE